ncbi:TfoX/Sxy family protein [Nordella sp. HKS 07]|uniref:TfoX/Sxy family protein n=1 Tax=Nordella sp. HKS 07 TaxID=2712222 RepID=UPI0013E174CD|nr:TfoX/Sxy family protein [Nordella sp. HKS 07]QIG50776.1 TfoX/Sxy family protein [Nordella sp. HKS 07]
MPASAEFLAFIKEQLADFGPVSVRRMFGGAGIFRDGLMFALVADEMLYLKADAISQGDFEALALPPFSYDSKGGKRTVMAYWRAPEACLDDRDEMTEWAGKAYGAALRAHKPAKRAPIRRS